MALWPQDQVAQPLGENVVAAVEQAILSTAGGSGAPVLSLQVPVPGSVVSPPVAAISFEVH